MWEWLTGWGIAKLIGFLICGLLIKPLLKCGFYIRQAVTDHKALRAFDQTLLEKLPTAQKQVGVAANWKLAPEVESQVAAAKRRRLVGFLAAPLGIVAILSVYAVLLPWWVGVIAVVLVVVGYFDVV
jgi:hypothetical protein